MSTHNEVAHAWANQTGKHRKGFNMFYRDSTIYSYGDHFPIARRVETSDGIVVLMTTKKYSVSTAKHIAYTWRAAKHFKILHVPFVAGAGCEADNVRDYIRSITETLEKAKRARVYGPSLMAEAEQMIIEAQEYIRVFEVTGFEEMTWDADSIVAGAREVARLQQAREAQARIIREAEAKRLYREETWPRIKAWLQGSDPITRNTWRPLPRVKGDIVQTTWGASVPLAIAKRLYWQAITCRRTHTVYVPTIGMKVGDFHLNRIKSNGDIVVGCHDIPFWFMRYAACRAGIPAVQPQALALA